MRAHRAKPLDLTEERDRRDPRRSARVYGSRIATAGSKSARRFTTSSRARTKATRSGATGPSSRDKFDIKDSGRVWNSFRGAKNPVTFRSLIQAAGENRINRDYEHLEIEDDEPGEADVEMRIEGALLVADRTDLTGARTSTFAENQRRQQRNVELEITTTTH